MSNMERTDCPACGYTVDATASECALCGADFIWIREYRRIVAQFLRGVAAALIGGALISMVVLIPFGLLAMYPRLVAPLWIASFALGLALWLTAGDMTKSRKES